MFYGPTEITCNCTYHIIDREYEPGENLPIGKPFPNEKVFLLDEEDREVTKPGEKGEICVSGTALSLGYYNNPEQTAKAFVQNPLNQSYLDQSTGQEIWHITAKMGICISHHEKISRSSIWDIALNLERLRLHWRQWKD